MKNFLASAIEAELGSLFVNCLLGAALRIFHKEMVHQQPPSLVVTYSATRDGFVNYNIRQQKYRAIDMRFYWLWDRVRQGNYIVYWERGKDNFADYFIKHYPTKYHCVTRGTHLIFKADSSNHTC